MPRPSQLMAQGVAYVAFIAMIGYLSASPSYRVVDADSAVLKLIFSHASDRVAECVILTPEQIAALPPNMRRPMDCPRERHPVLVELLMDGQLLYRATSQPTGLWRDGPTYVYERFVVEPGRHSIAVRLRDSARTSGFDRERTAEIDIQPLENLVIGFERASGFTVPAR